MFDEDEDDVEDITLGDQFQLVSRKKVQEFCDEIGKTNIQHNPYFEILKRADTFIEEGLTPEIFYNLYNGNFLVTSTENRIGKLH